MQQQPTPVYVDDDGHRYHSVADGARIIGPELISEGGLWNYAKAGRHPDSGLDLCVIKRPLLRTGHQKPRSARQFRFLVREDRILALKELLQDHRRHRTGLMKDEDKELMREAARRFRLPSSNPHPSL
jgi:hypothetical protein